MDNLELERQLDKYGVKTRDVLSQEYFSAVVKIAIAEYHISVSEIAREFGASRPTVTRWADGVSAPADPLKPVVLEWLIEKM